MSQKQTHKWHVQLSAKIFDNFKILSEIQNMHRYSGHTHTHWHASWHTTRFNILTISTHIPNFYLCISKGCKSIAFQIFRSRRVETKSIGINWICVGYRKLLRANSTANCAKMLIYCPFTQSIFMSGVESTHTNTHFTM